MNTLFELENTGNLLPFDGAVFLFESFLKAVDSQALIDSLLNEVSFTQDEVFVFGKRHLMNRSSAWIGDRPFSYGYSGLNRLAAPWTASLSALKKKVEEQSQMQFNSCLLNYYPQGRDGMGFHADNEKELGANPVIASVSLGAARKFVFKHNATKAKVDLVLPDGSLLLMKGAVQRHWQHGLPKTKKVLNPRLNLTFRNIIDTK